MRFHRKRACEGNTLTLSAGKLRRITVRCPFKLHQFEQLPHPQLNLLLGWARLTRPNPQAESDIVKDRHMPKQRIMLKYQPHSAFPGSPVGCFLAS